MLEIDWTAENGWGNPQIKPFQPLQLVSLFGTYILNSIILHEKHFRITCKNSFLLKQNFSTQLPLACIMQFSYSREWKLTAELMEKFSFSGPTKIWTECTILLTAHHFRFLIRSDVIEILRLSILIMSRLKHRTLNVFSGWNARMHQSSCWCRPWLGPWQLKGLPLYQTYNDRNWTNPRSFGKKFLTQ